MEVPATKYRDAKHIGLTLISNIPKLVCLPDCKHTKYGCKETEDDCDNSLGGARG